MTDMNKDPNNAQEETLELMFEKLDDILESLSERDIPLDKAFKLYEEGIKTVKKCNDKLDTVEKQMQVITGEDL